MRDKAERIETVASPPAHAGITRALKACYAKPPVLPEEWRRLLERLR